MDKQTKITYLLITSFFAFCILHNMVYAVFSAEEPVFFLLAIICFPLFLLSVAYNAMTFLRKGEPKDLWKLGFLGFLGLLSLCSRINLYWFFAFFAFFLTKNLKK